MEFVFYLLIAFLMINLMITNGEKKNEIELFFRDYHHEKQNECIDSSNVLSKPCATSASSQVNALVSMTPCCNMQPGNGNALKCIYRAYYPNFGSSFDWYCAINSGIKHEQAE